jgi:hypothetical protein
MTLGIECLLTDDAVRADELARTLDGINRDRRDIEGDMRDQAMEIAQSLFDEGEEPPPAVCVFDPDTTWTVTPGVLMSQGKHTPCAFDATGMALPGRVRATLVAGTVAHEAAAS